MSTSTSDGILLVTGRDMPVPDHETGAVVQALTDRGVRAEVRPWGEGTDWAAAGLVVVRTPWDYTRHKDDFLAWADEVARAGRLVNPPEVLRWNAHKGYLAELAAAGVPVVPTTLVPRGARAAEREAALRDHRGDVVAKPAVGAGSSGALRAAASSAEVTDHLAALTAVGDALVQPFVESVTSRGELSVVLLGGAVSHAVRKVPAAGDYRVQSEWGGTEQVVGPTPRELETARRAVALAPAAVTYARVDLVDVDGEPSVMELELIEPELFLGHAPGAVDRFADHLLTLHG
jgi:glutathione synthase/RimK-type ligase-like ATP-grasp enzyme